MPGDLAEVVGSAAERVENRSLLLEKFAFHKKWGLDGVEPNDAHRWTLLRIAEGGDVELAREARKRAGDAERLAQRGRNPEKAARLRVEAALANTLASTAKPPTDLAALRAQHTRRFLGLFRSAFGNRACVTIGQLEGRLAINLADGLIQNAGICLDRLFGLPFIPGSAVKGVCRHAALEELKKATGDQRAKLFRIVVSVFGAATSDFEAPRSPRGRDDKGKAAGSFFPYLDLTEPINQKGAVSFLPAYPVNESKVVVDLTNVHTPEYYRTGEIESLANERPLPNPFPVVEAGAQFAFCLVLNRIDQDPALLDHARRWLEMALTVHGLGAKTAAGYGWFALRPDVLTALEEEEARSEAARRAAAEAAEQARRAQLAEEARQAGLSPEDRAAEQLLRLSDDDFAAFAKALSGKSEPEQRAFFKLLGGPKRDRWKAWKRRKPAIVQVLEEVRNRLNLPPLP